jgi:hypothetical protein
MIHLSTDDHLITMYYQSLQGLTTYNSDDHHYTIRYISRLPAISLFFSSLTSFRIDSFCISWERYKLWKTSSSHRWVKWPASQEQRKWTLIVKVYCLIFIILTPEWRVWESITSVHLWWCKTLCANEKILTYVSFLLRYYVGHKG